jgi:class 3 adenylate cyclase
LRMVIQLQSQGIIRNGIYYIVLCDLVASTKYSAEKGNKLMNQRIQSFVLQSFQALTESKIINTAIFLKEIGDAVLFIFQHFPDILKWRDNFQRRLDILAGADPYVLRTCVHVGEVSLMGVNPISLAISQTFKMEKAVKAGEIGLTEPAYHIAWPTITRAYRGFSDYGEVDLDGFKDKVKLYKLNLHDMDDLSRIVEENS